MNFYKRVKLEVNMTIWWKMAVYVVMHASLVIWYGLNKHNTYLEYGYNAQAYYSIPSSMLNAFIELTVFTVLGIIYFIVCMSNRNTRMKMVKKSFKQMSDDEKKQLDELWESAQKKDYDGQIVGVAANYLIIRVRTSYIRWYMIPTKSVRTISLKTSGKTKSKIVIKYIDSLVFNGETNPPVRVDVTTGKFSNEIVNYVADFINYAIHQNIHTKVFHLKSSLFDTNGSYGGRQRISINMPAEMRENAKNMISLRYNRSQLSDEEFNMYLEKLASEGCGYVALVNSIFMFYEDKEKEFVDRFGYPMYSEKGDFNFEFLLLDLYSGFDNVNPQNGRRDNFMDYKQEDDGEQNEYNYWMDITGRGATAEERKYYIENFMQAHGVEAEYKNYAYVTPQNFEQYVSEGWTVIVSLYNGYLLRDNKMEHVARHAMVVTGVTETGWFIVSSWGKMYIFDPQNNDYTTFSLVRYK